MTKDTIEEKHWTTFFLFHNFWFLQLSNWIFFSPFPPNQLFSGTSAEKLSTVTVMLVKLE